MITIAVLGTFDTKGTEHAFVADQIRQLGMRTILIDIGTGGPPTITPDITREQVEATALRYGRGTLPAVHDSSSLTDRGEAIAKMSFAVPYLLRELVDQQKIHGVISLGGSGGTALGTAAMRALPLGFPKVMVSTVAGGNVKPYVDVSDIIMVPSVVDVSGLNRISRGVFARAASMVVALAASQSEAQGNKEISQRPLVVASMFGNTTKCVEHAKKIIEAAGYEVVTFHATGIGGRTMEALIDSGEVAGVLDITTTEWADQLVGGIMPGGPHRLEAAARRGVPAVIAPGCLDMVNFGERSSVPQTLQGRLFYQHNPQVTLMRTSAEECKQLGSLLAEKINLSIGPVKVMIPKNGVSVIGAIGGPFYDRQADEALFASIRSNLRSDIPYEVLECEINDPKFASACAAALLKIMQST